MRVSFGSQHSFRPTQFGTKAYPMEGDGDTRTVEIGGKTRELPRQLADGYKRLQVEEGTPTANKALEDLLL